MNSISLPLAIAGFALAGAVLAFLICRWKGLDIWLAAYCRNLFRRVQPTTGTPIHLLVCVADHFEPGFERPGYEQECQRVARWAKELPTFASQHIDSDGRPYQHTFFYPEEEYRPEHLNALAQLCHSGYGDVEIHLHHDHDTAEQTAEKLTRFKSILHHRHGLLHVGPSGEIEYAFIHGNWALDNSGPHGRFCGVNNELTVLQQTGCYVDMTMPAAPERAQTSKINSIYYAQDDPAKPKSHDTGPDAVANRVAPPGLLMIQGPLTLNWASRKFGLMPRVENGELSGDNPPTPARADLWVQQHIHVQGQPNWVFIKLHTHGANEMNTSTLLGDHWRRTLQYLEQHYNDGRRYALHYVTAREMYHIVKAAEAGAQGNPGQYRQFTAVHSECA